MPVYNQSRSRVIQLIFVAIFLIITAQLLHLQIFSSEYKIQAENNAIYRKVVYPDRGIVYDRKSRAILENTIMYDLMVTPKDAREPTQQFSAPYWALIPLSSERDGFTAIIKNTSYKPSVFAALVSDDIYAQLNENMYRLPGFVLSERASAEIPF